MVGLYTLGIKQGSKLSDLMKSMGKAVGAIAIIILIIAAGILLPIVEGTDVMPELMVLATGSGSLLFSHFNDIRFWMFKEYYNVSIKHTFAI